MPTTAERDRARGLATSLVSWAIMLAGGAFLALAVALAFTGGLPFVVLSLFIAGLAVLVLAGGFFFHLVPLRMEALAEAKREADSTERQEEAEKDKRLGKL